MKSLFPIIFVLTLLILLPDQTMASGCFRDPVYTHTWTGVITTGARVRDVACMEDSKILTTVAVGKTISIIGETDGWYKVKLTDGTIGWIGQWLISITDKTKTPTPATPETPAAPAALETPTPPKPPTPPTPPTLTLLSRTRGYILLQVENHGEAWYVNPTDDKRYYMKDGPTAYEMMRAFGLGITDHDLTRLKTGNHDLVERLKGRIVLQVEQHGEAYYIHPREGSTHYLKDGAAAYQIMRALSLGVTNHDLNKLTSKTFIPLAQTPKPTADETLKPTNSEYDQISLSDYQQGTVPAGIDLLELNQYWLNKVNALRAQKRLRQLVLDQRFVDTATDYAAYMGINHATGHERADGSSMHQWIDQKELDFTTRYTTDGWRTNYFTENISWGYAEGTTTGAKKVLDSTMAFYLAEESYNGAHYRTTYHSDWNSVGVGFYFEPMGQDRYKVYCVFHYGSLNLK
ncbi:SH3 domain-containing protein [Patescibacteria group bacterium]